MLQCVGCGLHAVVQDPWAQEWMEAFHAPSRPYRWDDESRVVVKGLLSGDQRYVVRTAVGPKCECYTRRNVPNRVSTSACQLKSPGQPCG